MMNEENWVKEVNSSFGLTFKVTEHIHHEQTPYQTIDLYNTEKLGKLLMLNGIIQLTEFDEFAYQEMMTHTVLFACKNPQHVLVIGGGDGGVLREIAKHKEVKTIDICEIDQQVVEVSKKFLPSLSCGFDDPRVKLHIADGSLFIKNYKNYFDAIIIDSTDPGGISEPLFGKEFYQDLKTSLREGGVIGSQSETPFLLPETVKHLQKITGDVFDYTAYGMFYVPTYPMGSIGICCGGIGVDPTQIAREIPEEMQKTLKYYNAEIHSACFKLPEFVKRLINL